MIKNKEYYRFYLKKSNNYIIAALKISRIDKVKKTGINS